MDPAEESCSSTRGMARPTRSISLCQSPLCGVASVEIDLVVITATDPEVEAVLRRLEPYPKRRAILKGFVEQETYYLGRFGSCLAAVTKCRMGSLDSGAATLATQHAQHVWRPRAVVMVGIALGKDPAKQKIADAFHAKLVDDGTPSPPWDYNVAPTILSPKESVPQVSGNMHFGEHNPFSPSGWGIHIPVEAWSENIQNGSTYL